MSQEHDFAFCATAWSGMAAEDIPNAVKLLGELSGFASLPDRLQQGFVNQLYLGRLLIHPNGLTTDPAFKGLVNPSRLYYDGNSQGGILGTALTAIAPDFTRAVLGVPGINFSVLLTRSSNWDTYGAVFNPGYPRQADRPLVLSLINQLWDRGEGDGWAHHVTNDPPAGTPAHRVLMHAAVGDFQVTTYQADVLARTVGASVHKPAFLPGRSLERVPTFGIPAINAEPVRGLGARLLGQRAGAAGRLDRQRADAAGEHAAARGQGPALGAAQHPRRAAAEGAVPAHRQRGRRVRREAVRVQLHEGALGREVAAPEGDEPDRGQRRGDRLSHEQRPGAELGGGQLRDVLERREVEHPLRQPEQRAEDDEQRARAEHAPGRGGRARDEAEQRDRRATTTHTAGAGTTAAAAAAGAGSRRGC